MKKVEELEGFRERRKKRLNIFHLDDDFIMTDSPFKGYPFYSDSLIITPQGKIVIKQGYRWNGCTPKFNIANMAILGTFDGKLDKITNKPQLYYATLVHDVLYHYYGYHGIPLKKLDRLFLKMMRESGFPKAKLYYNVVRAIGVVNGLIQNTIKLEKRTKEYKRGFWKANRKSLSQLYRTLKGSNIQSEAKAA